MARVTALPDSCLMALVTSSLVSRTATSWSTGMSQAQMAARTWPRASEAAAGPVVSLTRHWFSSVGRVGAIAFIGFLSGPVQAGPAGAVRPARLLPALPVAPKMLLQLAVRDIGQLTDIEHIPAVISGYAGQYTVVTRGGGSRGCTVPRRGPGLAPFPEAGARPPHPGPPGLAAFRGRGYKEHMSARR